MAPAKNMPRKTIKPFGKRGKPRVKGTPAKEAARLARGSAPIKRDLSKVVHRAVKPPPPPHPKTKREETCARNAEAEKTEEANLGARLKRTKERKEFLAKKHQERQLAFLDELLLDGCDSEAKHEPSVFTVSRPESPAYNRDPLLELARAATEAQKRASADTDKDDSSVHSPHTPSDDGKCAAWITEHR
jgi:hypothetical protein